MKRLVFVACLSVLAGCASQVMHGFVGKPVQTVMMQYGPPSNAFDLPDGMRAFQWEVTQAGVTPTYIASTGVAAPAGNAAVWATRTRITGGQPIVSRCLYTMTGRWSEQANTWMMTGFQKPGFNCE